MRANGAVTAAGTSKALSSLNHPQNGVSSRCRLLSAVLSATLLCLRKLHRLLQFFFFFFLHFLVFFSKSDINRHPSLPTGVCETKPIEHLHRGTSQSETDLERMQGKTGWVLFCFLQQGLGSLLVTAFVFCVRVSVPQTP